MPDFRILEGDVIERTAVGVLWRPGMMSSVRSDWATPRTLFRMLDREFAFSLDVCAAEQTATCAEWFGADALDRPWAPVNNGSVWCNPPYGRGLGRWVEKAYREASRHSQTVVMLLPARSDTAWFHDYCLRGEIRFLRGRLEFDDRPSTFGRAPFPSMIVIFRPRRDGQAPDTLLPSPEARATSEDGSKEKELETSA